MTFHILTLFPEIIEGYVNASLMDKAAKRGIVRCNLVNIRDFAKDRHRTCDDAPYGGGAGMVLKPEPLGDALDSVRASDKRTVFPTPSGVPFTAEYAKDLSEEDELVIICGRYEGIDERIAELYVDDEISVGDYVLSSGEVAALIVVDAVYRLIEGVIKGESLKEESFVDGLLEYPHYTRPEIYRGLKAPDVLLSGHHKQIEEWRLSKSLEKTKKNRPDLYDGYMKRRGTIWIP